MRLKNAKVTESMIVGTRRSAKKVNGKGLEKSLTTIERRTATSRFEAGPAREISAESRLGLFKL